eukprot:6995291-Pyramimonas_sp.AAC.1
MLLGCEGQAARAAARPHCAHSGRARRDHDCERDMLDVLPLAVGAGQRRRRHPGHPDPGASPGRAPPVGFGGSRRSRCRLDC